MATKYRELHIPVDNIVQDWFWWNRKGEFVFNKNYPDPKGMIDKLHQENFHLMISIWPFFEPGLADVRLHGEARLVRRQVQVRRRLYHTDAMACTTPRILKRASTTGIK